MISRPLMVNVTRFEISRLSQHLSTQLFDLCCKVFSAKKVCLGQHTSCAIALSRKPSVLYAHYIIYYFGVILVLFCFVFFLLVTHRCTESGLGRIIFLTRESW